MFDRCRRARDRTALNIIDLGASCGVNAALLKRDLSLEQLFGRYTDPDSRSVETMELLNKDRGSVRLKFWAIFNLLMVVKNRRFSAQFMDSLESHFQPNWR